MDIKKIYKQLRQDIIENASVGGHSQRIRLLAYGYLRNKPYAALERKTQFDNNCDVGKETCYSFLASQVVTELKERLNEYTPSTGEAYLCDDYKQVSAWMRERWDTREKAA